MTEANPGAIQTASITEPTMPRPDEVSATPWIVFLLGVALILALFIILALVASRATPTAS